MTAPANITALLDNYRPPTEPQPNTSIVEADAKPPARIEDHEPPPLVDAVLTTIFTCWPALAAKHFTRTDPAGVWAKALEGVTESQVMRGMTRCAQEGGEFPPSPPEFRRMCLRPDDTHYAHRAEIEERTAPRCAKCNCKLVGVHARQMVGDKCRGCHEWAAAKRRSAA